MQFRIADTFTSSLGRLQGDEQKAVKTTAFDLQIDPSGSGLQFHRLDRAKDKNFWSVRVNRDIRLIVHRTDQSLLLCYVAHHDDAYAWAERRKLETHPTTGAAQLVEIRETVIEIPVERYFDAAAQPVEQPDKPPLFANVPGQELLGYGVPPEWLAAVLQANEDTLLDLAEHLPSEAAEALLERATGGTPQVAVATTVGSDPFRHPDAQRRFRMIENVEELERALDFPWDKWTIFLHPAQRELVEREFSGPARVAGSAGTGKTVVALHRAVFLARKNPDARVLLTTFSRPLANLLQGKLYRLVRNEPKLAERIDVYSIQEVGERLYRPVPNARRIADSESVSKLLVQAAEDLGAAKFSSRFILSEWSDVVDAWQLRTWEDYRDVKRLGRKTRLSEEQRQALWTMFSRVQEELEKRGIITMAGMFTDLAASMPARKNLPYDHAVVDEAQDVSIPQLRFLAALGAGKPNALFFAGDLGQRIFQQPFSWLSLGVDIRGRSRRLQINYRTSHQIRSQADRLLGPRISDVDGIEEERTGTISVFNGPEPEIREFATPELEIRAVGQWLKALVGEGVKPHEISVFVRSEKDLERALAAVQGGGLQAHVLDADAESMDDRVPVSTMHLAKGMEFKAVAVMACDDEVLPSQERIETVSDPSDLEEVYKTERHLLYVACTRARDHLLVTAGGQPSEFLHDLREAPPLRSRCEAASR